MNNLEELEQSVIEWAKEKQIFEKGTAIKQGEKTGEEYSEMMRALGKQELLDSMPFDESLRGIAHQVQDEIADSIGDQVVTLIIQARMQGLTLGTCLQTAYDVISKRSGSMIGGKFVKDAEPAAFCEQVIFDPRNPDTGDKHDKKNCKYCKRN